MKEFAGKVAVVTGAASGIGLALAHRFGELGMHVVLADVQEDALDAAGKALGQQGGKVLTVPTDVRKAHDVAGLASATLEAFGAVHVVCNNAGVFGGAGYCWDAPLEDYEWVLGVNLWGVVHGIRTFVPILLEQDTEGHIVNTASMAAVTSGPLSAIYYMSKHAVLSASESLYHELTQRQSKIGVSALCPEGIATQINRSERNRPDSLRSPALASSSHEPAGSHKGVPSNDGGLSPEGQLVQDALDQLMASGTSPSVIAERVVAAIRDNRFYVLSEDAWRQSCDTRLEDIRLARNPTFVVPGSF
jgi:NAD(P)-dependent dehydrogenase (short-subunit alcohol dehydrogenase family)